jgi:hypothetical protein
VIEAAIELVWSEVNEEGYGMIPDPLTARPDDVLVAAALATRRVWLRHHRLARYMSATPRASEFLSSALALLANVFERLGHPGEEAASRFHTYASFTLGSVLFAAARIESSEAFDDGEAEAKYRSRPGAEEAAHSSDATRLSLDEVVDLSAADPERDERLFVEGLRRLIASFG